MTKPVSAVPRAVHDHMSKLGKRGIVAMREKLGAAAVSEHARAAAKKRWSNRGVVEPVDAQG